MKRQQELDLGINTKNLLSEQANSKATKNYEDLRNNPHKHAKACKVCGEVKLLTCFPFATRRIDRRETICKDCASEQQKRAKHWYPILTEEHGAKCSICGVKEEDNGKRLAVDHCHKTGKVRGLLCDNHNHGIGKFNDDVRLMKKAIKYLEKHNEKATD
jgi:hypothetical protein